ncbi:MAG: nucleotide sugar dehydrogenase [Elusimicrobia bacterium]|nr:nucleotide sugar dehydrogenase [Elusimicrobiota bacterium]
MRDERICVLGLGYIGLPTASILATHGFKVFGVDKRKEILESLRCGKAHIKEPGLNTIVKAAVQSGRLVVNEKVCRADVFIICVPTPHNHVSPAGQFTGPLSREGSPFNRRGKKTADLSFVQQAAESIVSYLRPGNLVIIESTVPPKTVENIVMPILAKSKLRIPGDISIAHCPERVLPGNILHELVSNDRIIGGIDIESCRRAENIYASFTRGEIYLTDCATAETIKLVENAFRDVNIAFANEIEAICEHIGINAWEVIRLANRHPRVKILQPGPGVGGHCIAVDPWFLAQAAPAQARLVKTARTINDSKPWRVIAKITKSLAAARRRRVPLGAAGKKKSALLCLGITYKANVDDIRESPGLFIARHFLKRKNVELMIADPHAPKSDDLPFVDLEQGLKKADVIALLVNHREFLQVNWKKIISEKGHDFILDFKGALK